MHKVIKEKREKRSNWEDVSVRVGEDYLKDDEYHELNTLTKPLLAYLIEKYENKPTDAADFIDSLQRDYMGTFSFIGKEALPLAIEMSQWGYQIYSVLEESMDNEHLKNTLNRQASQIENIIFQPYHEPLPQSRVIVVVGLIDNLVDESYITRLVDEFLSRCDELLLCLVKSRDWREYFGEYQVEYIKDDDAQSFLSITSGR